MKYIKYLLLSAFIFIFCGINVLAASASISVSSSKIEEGKSVTATVNMNGAAAWNIKISSSGSTSGCTKSFADASSDGNNINKSFSVTCKSTSTGIISFILSGDITSSDGKNISVSGKKSVTVTEPREKSSNNKLKSLSVEGYEISPEFDSSINEYSVTVPSTIEKIVINAKKADSYASIDGIGEKSVEEGVNTFEIIVTSETGVSNIYKLTVNVEDQNPIEININGKKYTVVKVAKNLEKPELFDETTIKINDFDIPAFYNYVCKYTLVVLKDDNGIIELFIYKDGKYSKYNEFKSDSLPIIFLDMNKIPSNYKKTNITINETKVTAYKTDNSDKVLLYALNISTGKKNYYTYDLEEKTLQIFNVKEYENVLKANRTNYYIIIGLTSLVLLLFILVILFSSKANKLKKIINIKKEVKDKKKSDFDF